MLEVFIAKGVMYDIKGKKPSIYKELGMNKILKRLNGLNRNFRIKFNVYLTKKYAISKTEQFESNEAIKILASIPRNFN